MQSSPFVPRLLRAVALLGLIFTALACRKTRPPHVVTVAAAMSLRGVMPELVNAYANAHPDVQVSVTYGASGDLANQVESGAPVDAVVFAGGRPVDALIAEGRAVAGTRRVVASNEIVLVGRTGERPVTFATLETLPEGERVAIGDPRTVPAGEYARAYLQSLGVWDALGPRVILGSSVAAVLVYVARGEAAAGVVYRTELHEQPELMILDRARGASAPHPEVVAAEVTGASPETAELLSFIASPAAGPVLASFGFGPR